jgi:hypothetical protein
MSIIQRFGSVALALCIAVWLPKPSGAAEVTIDAFTEATNTKIDMFVPQMFVNQASPSTMAMDTGLSLTSVVGGSRKVTLNATFLQDQVDDIIAGVDPSTPDFCYAATDHAIGEFVLLYDRGGLGLQNVNLSHAQGIEIGVLAAGSSATPYSVKITLEDAFGSTSSQQSSADPNHGLDVCLNPPPECAPFKFPFTDFPGVNLRRIVRITVLIDVNEGGDIQFGPISTYGTPTIETICDDGEDNDNNGFIDCADPACVNALNCIETVPLLSTGMMSALIGILGVVGLVGLRRKGWHH